MKTSMILKSNWMVLVGVFCVIFMAMGCAESDPSPNHPTEIRFQLLNEIGEPSVMFKEGENFSFSFMISNMGENDLRFSPSFLNEDFFMVYRMVGSEESIPVAKPYQNAFCVFTSSLFVIPSQSEYRFEIPWNPKGDFCCPPFCMVTNTPPLPVGIYRTSIRGPIEFRLEEKAILVEYDYLIEFEIF